MTSSAAAVTSSVRPNGPSGDAAHRAGRLARVRAVRAVRVDGEDLVDAHPAVLEGQGAPGQVQAPQADLLRGEELGDGGYVLLEVVQPGPDGPRVVLAHGLDADDLEPGLLDQPHRLPHRAHVHVRRDVGLDKRAAARRAAAPGHLLDQQPAARLERLAQRRAEPGIAGGADVLAHLDRRDRVERAVQRVPVVTDPDLGPVAEAQAPHALPGVAALPGRQGHGGHPGVVIAGGVDRERAPAAAHVQQPVAGLQVQLAADQLQLGLLRAGQRVRVLEPPARVRHAGVQDELVELGGHVVVAGDHGLVAVAAVPPAVDPQLAVRRRRRRPEGDLEADRRGGGGPGGRSPAGRADPGRGGQEPAQPLGEVAVDVEVAADEGAGQAQLARAPQEPAAARAGTG